MAEVFLKWESVSCGGSKKTTTLGVSLVWQKKKTQTTLTDRERDETTHTDRER